jgi:hypothetical protein
MRGGEEEEEMICVLFWKEGNSELLEFEWF